jgi:limonene-1,2-epoxide hydrolase
MTVAASPPQVFSLSSQQAEEVSAAVRFVNAFNARDLEGALALVASNAVVSDCDYRRVQPVSFTGRRSISTWLRRRFADHDKLTASRFYNENSAQLVGTLAVDYTRRSSDTLRALGFRRGIVPLIASKLVFSTSAPRIVAFANGPVGGSPEACRPSVSPPPAQPPVSGPYALSARQANGVSVVVQFLAAYNAGKLAAALAQFTAAPNFVRYVGVSDSNYSKRRVDGFRSRSGVAAWLRSRFADRDRMTLAAIRAAYSSGGKPSDAGAVVRYARRTSNSLNGLGFPQGIEPPGLTKVGFANSGVVGITHFANAATTMRSAFRSCDATHEAAWIGVTVLRITQWFFPLDRS